jgi:hypothetical protein
MADAPSPRDAIVSDLGIGDRVLKIDVQAPEDKMRRGVSNCSNTVPF